LECNSRSNTAQGGWITTLGQHDCELFLRVGLKTFLIEKGSLTLVVGGPCSSFFRRSSGTPGVRAVWPTPRRHLRVLRPRVPPLVSAAFPRPWSRGSPRFLVVGSPPVPLPPSGVAVLPMLCLVFFRSSIGESPSLWPGGVLRPRTAPFFCSGVSESCPNFSPYRGVQLVAWVCRVFWSVETYLHIAMWLSATLAVFRNNIRPRRIPRQTPVDMPGPVPLSSRCPEDTQRIIWTDSHCSTLDAMRVMKKNKQMELNSITPCECKVLLSGGSGCSEFPNPNGYHVE